MTPSKIKNLQRALKPGDLCRLVGTTGWGDICVVINPNGNGVGGVEVLRQDGKLAIIAPSFLSREDP